MEYNGEEKQMDISRRPGENTLNSGIGVSGGNGARVTDEAPQTEIQRGTVYMTDMADTIVKLLNQLENKLQPVLRAGVDTRDPRGRSSERPPPETALGQFVDMHGFKLENIADFISSITNRLEL